MRELAATTPGELRLYRLDVFAMTEQVRADPAAFGFTDIVTPCSGATRCEGHLFWDQVHPTTYAHGRLAEAALRELAGQDPPP
nr:SGNH/GDSL hydrolase family protein [Geminicoccus flavidas]